MNPDQIAVLTAVASIVSKIGTWPIGSIIAAVVLCPWFSLLFISRAMERRMDAALKMYENNVGLVKNYEKIADEQADTIRLSIAATTELTTWLKNKTPCHTMLRARRES